MSKLLGHSSTVVTERAYAELLGSTIRDELLARSATRGDRVVPGRGSRRLALELRDSDEAGPALRRLVIVCGVPSAGGK